MSRPNLFLVTDQSFVAEEFKKYCEEKNANCQVFSPTQWVEGLEHPNFRQLLVNGLPALAGGFGVPSPSPLNLVQFPGSYADHKVHKMEEVEAKAIEDAILQYKGNLTEAAKALGIGRATLYRKVKQYQIDTSVARRRKIAA